MRVAFHAPMKRLDDPTPSGDGRVARLLVEALERGGATVEMPSAFRSYDRGDPVRQRRLESLGGRLAERILGRYRSGQAPAPDVWFTYHLYHKAPDHLGPRIASALGVPYVVAEASHAPKQAGGPWDAGYHAAERAIRAAERIFCFNPVDAACLRPLVRNDAVLSDLPPFIDTAPFREARREHGARRREAAARFGFDPELPLILTVAMMRRDQKLASYAVLADALDRLGGRAFTLLVVGSGPAEPEVRAHLARLGEKVRFAGRREGADLVALYAAADLFVWPAVKEAFGVAFIEAAAAGLAIVAGRSGGIGHIVEDGRTGLVVDAGDAPAFASALDGLLGDPVPTGEMGRRAMHRAQSVNDIGVASAQLSRDLAHLISRPNSGGAV